MIKLKLQVIGSLGACMSLIIYEHAVHAEGASRHKIYQSKGGLLKL